MKINCSIKDCPNVFITNDINDNGVIHFICKNHWRGEQLLALNREITREDFLDEDIHFQEFQFDKNLVRDNPMPFDAEIEVD